MKDNFYIVVFVNVVYILFSILLIRLRSSNNRIMKEWDNGYDFYASLNDVDKESYWKEDTKILKIVLCVLLFVVDSVLFLYCVFPTQWYWLIILIIGGILSIMTAILLSIRLQKKYRRS